MMDVGSLGPREQTDPLFHSMYRGWGERSELLKNNLGRKANTVCTQRQEKVDGSGSKAI